jgi:hypothetical protein
VSGDHIYEESCVPAVKCNGPNITLASSSLPAFFGPSDVALASAELTGPVGQLDEILKSHVVTGVYSAADLLNAGDCMILDTLSTSMPKIKITIMDHGDQKMILVNNGKSDAFEMTEYQSKSQTLTLTRVFTVHVIVPDVVADNGIFHGVDGVILPNSFTPCKTEAPTLSPDTATSLSTLSHFAAMVAVSATLLLAL